MIWIVLYLVVGCILTAAVLVSAERQKGPFRTVNYGRAPILCLVWPIALFIFILMVLFDLAVEVWERMVKKL